jgi:neutral ceramidase
MRARTMCVMVLLGMVSARAADAQGFRAGAGREDIQIPSALYPVQNFAAQHDPLAVRVLLLDDARTRVGIVVVDLTSMTAQTIASLKGILEKTGGVRPENAIVTVSHTFSAPHIFLGGGRGGDDSSAQEVERVVESAMQSAATKAAATIQPARMGVADHGLRWQSAARLVGQSERERQ